jgi:nitroreductase
MVAPGPDGAALDRILTGAMRVPDHGKIAPWRFVVIGPDQRGAFADLLERAYRAEQREPGKLEMEAIAQFARQAPTLVAIISTPNPDSHIPLWEQELSAGAACTGMLFAAHAEGFVGSWLTGWAAFSPMVAQGLGFPGGKIAGFLYFGTPSKPLEERPRPEPQAIVSHWQG